MFDVAVSIQFKPEGLDISYLPHYKRTKFHAARRKSGSLIVNGLILPCGDKITLAFSPR